MSGFLPSWGDIMTSKNMLSDCARHRPWALRWPHLSVIALTLGVVLQGGESVSSGAQEADLGDVDGLDDECRGCIRPPRWVLRDRDGFAVPALVEPRCGRGDVPVRQENLCLPLEFGSTGSFPCVRINAHNGRYINLQYDLETGGLERCNRNGDWAEDFSEIAFFLGDSCEDDPYGAFGVSGITNSTFTESRRLDFVDGEIWYVTEEPLLVDVPASHWTIFEPKQCLPVIGSGSALKPVPDWVHHLLPNPPYTMAVEYD